ncbi:MAG: peptidase MA family metallohydrolase [Phycisphaerales bacterium]
MAEGAAVRHWLSAIAVLVTAAGTWAQYVPERVTAPASLDAALDSAARSPEARQALRIRHGRWLADDLATPAQRARAAIDMGSFRDAALDDGSVPVALRGEVLVRRGRAEEALSLLAGCEEPTCALVRADALALLGRVNEAIAQLDPLERAAADAGADPEAWFLGAQATQRRGALEPLPPDRWKRALDWLGRAREQDRLDPRVPLLEGRLLMARHNREEGVPALQQSLALHPRQAETWFALGRAALEGFDFDAAARAIEALYRLAPDSVHGDLLAAERFLLLEDSERAQSTLDALLEREPDMPEALALNAAVAARRWDRQAVESRLAEMDRRFPGQALGAATVGRLLALHRQYAWAERMLRTAIERRPAWSEPRGELGQLLLQTGREDDARKALAEAAALDPFDKRSAFGRWLLDEMAGYRVIESPHFRIRVKPGIDEVVAESMPEALERMHEDVCARFGHEPSEKTTIEVLPDHEFFAVRITGMPGIHTMAASTGPVIAMEVPRRGNPRRHLGTFDWLEVLRHEYAHTVTLSQTENRIPHWLTEALAVSVETKPRTYETCMQLAQALRTGKLFPLDRIKWAFVRPETPNDRPLAYAQGRWMVEFLESTWSDRVVQRLLERYRLGDDEEAALRATIGIGADAFFDQFKLWAKAQVRAWGLLPDPSMSDLLEIERASDPAHMEQVRDARAAWQQAMARAFADRVMEPFRLRDRKARDWPELRLPRFEITDEILDRWLSEHPEHPDLLELKIRRRLEDQPELNETSRALLRAYALARPVDPMPDRLLARAQRGQGAPADALASLRRLDLLEERDPAYALEIARLLRQQGDAASAMQAATKASRIDGYDPSTRELAAAIAIEAGRLDEALRHVRALERLEPDRPVHAERARRIEARMLAPSDTVPK